MDRFKLNLISIKVNSNLKSLVQINNKLLDELDKKSNKKIKNYWIK